MAEALAAREAFITSATTIVTPVVRIDGKPVGDGKPGPVTRRLRQAFYGHAEMAPALSSPTPAEKTGNAAKLDVTREATPGKLARQIGLRPKNANQQPRRPRKHESEKHG